MTNVAPEANHIRVKVYLYTKNKNWKKPKTQKEKTRINKVFINTTTKKKNHTTSQKPNKPNAKNIPKKIKISQKLLTKQNKYKNTKAKRNKKINYRTKNPLITPHSPHINLLILCGDIETNPGPMPNILKNHPSTHKRKAKTYFIPNTIKLHPEYIHLTKKFAPLLKNTHSLHHHISLTLPHLHEYIQQKLTDHPTSHILYAIIITISPSIDTCNELIARQPTLRTTTE